MAKRKTTEEFIADAIKVHGDKYDYSKVEYIDSTTKIIIVCPIHGDFKQTPNSHLNGKTCKQCSLDKRKRGLIEYVKAANKVHNYRYNYTKTVYKSNKALISITCSVHGDYTQRADAHLRGQGCPKCVHSFPITTEDFIKKAQNVHGSKYMYGKTKYTTSRSKLAITCPIHGDFSQKASNHLEGSGCPSCHHDSLRMSQKEFIQKANQIHNSKFDYSNSNYINSATKIKIICPEHGEFEQIPDSHLKGHDCPDCAKGGVSPNTPTYLYYLEVITDSKELLYKIGITIKPIEQRFTKKELSKINVINSTLYNTGKEAYEKEQYLLTKYKNYQYKGPKVLNSGNTELFTEDIMKLERNVKNENQ